MELWYYVYNFRYQTLQMKNSLLGLGVWKVRESSIYCYLRQSILKSAPV